MIYDYQQGMYDLEKEYFKNIETITRQRIQAKNKTNFNCGIIIVSTFN